MKFVQHYAHLVVILHDDPVRLAPEMGMSPFWILFQLRMTEVVSGAKWSYKSCKAPVKMSTNQHPAVYRPDALPVAQPTVSKHRREILSI